MVIDEKIVKLLNENSISLMQFFVLYCLHNDLTWHKDLKEDRVSTYQTLVRRGFLDKDNFIATEKGVKLLSGHLKKRQIKKVVGIEDKKKAYETWFAEFWNAFPTSDRHRHWPRTRTLRSGKVKAFKTYSDILDGGEYSHEQILSALEADIAMKHKASIIENQLKYMQAINTWLNKRIFEGFIEDTEENNNINRNTYGQELE